MLRRQKTPTIALPSLPICCRFAFMGSFSVRCENASCGDLEDQFCSELHIARTRRQCDRAEVGIDIGAAFCGWVGSLGGGSSTERGVRYTQVDVIESIERFQPQFQLEAITDGCCFESRKIKIESTRASHPRIVSRSISKAVICGICEGCRVEPLGSARVCGTDTYTLRDIGSCGDALIGGTSERKGLTCLRSHDGIRLKTTEKPVRKVWILKKAPVFPKGSS